jgi:hypothetical protein
MTAAVPPAFAVSPSGFVVVRGSGEAVVHPTLASIPFERSVRGWVAAYFPHAAYTEVTDAGLADGVAPPDLRREAGIVAIQAPKGLGKSKAIRRALAALPAHTTAVQITFRQCLALTSYRNMGDAGSLYMDVPRGTAISARHHPRLTIVVNSIARIRGMFDVVIIDELVSVLDALAGSLLSGAARVTAAHTLRGLLAAARVVVVADAMLDATALQFVVGCRGGAVATPAALTVLDYTRRIHGDTTYVAHASYDTWEARLRAYVLAGKRVVVPCMTKAAAVRVAAVLRPLLGGGDEHLLCYTADTAPAVMQVHMRDIHAHWARVQVLVYSPVITAGCSFELPHFDAVFFYGRPGLGSVRSAAQMIARVRDIREHVVHVFIAGVGAGSMLPAPPAAHAPSPGAVVGVDTGADPRDAHVHMLGLLERYRATEDAHAAHNFSYYFWTLVVHSGARISYPASALAEHVPPGLLAAAAAHAAPPPEDVHEVDVRAPGVEAWLAHDWDIQSTGMSTYPTSATAAVRLAGTLLQRAHWCNPEHVLDAGLCGPAAGEAESVVPGTPGTPWASGAPWDASPRLRAWVGLISQRAMLDLVAAGRATAHFMDGFALQAMPEAAEPAEAAGAVVELAAPIQFRVFPPPCASPKAEHVRFASPAVRAACAPQVRAFTHPPAASARSWMDLQQAAWVLAALDVALRTGGVVGEDALEAMEEPCMEAGVCATGALVPLFLRARFVAVNVCVGDGVAGIGVLDYLLRGHDGRWHAVVCRASGDPATTGPTDLVKARVLAGAAAESGRIRAPIASVRVLYLPSGLQIVVDVEASAPLCRLYRTVAVEGALPPWALDTHVAYAHTRDGHVADVLVDGAATVGVPIADVFTAMQGEPTRRWVTWGWRAVMDVAAAMGDARAGALLHAVRDLEIVVAMRVGAASTHAQAALLDMENARVTLATPPRAPDAPPASAAHDLRHLYMGVVTKGLLVYFWDSRPHGLDIRTLPTLATLQAVLRP